MAKKDAGKSNGNNKHFDLIVIGGGPGGYVGAIRATQLGKRVACVERDKLGGVCLNWGCIPTKALLKNAYLYTEVSRHGDEFGLEFERLTVNWEKVIGRSRNVADQLNKGIHFLFKKNNVTHLDGHAVITRASSGNQPCEIKLYDKPGGELRDTYTADNILVATGAHARELPFAQINHDTIIAYKDAMILKERPDSMVVIGAGAIGVEFAYFYNAFGTEVTIIEMMDHLVPAEDADIAKVLEREFKKSGMKFKTRHTVKNVEVVDR
ncbi:MAG: FAD-dependent oxidoreductase, partial [Planctomycetota bacterium]